MKIQLLLDVGRVSLNVFHNIVNKQRGCEATVEDLGTPSNKTQGMLQNPKRAWGRCQQRKGYRFLGSKI